MADENHKRLVGMRRVWEGFFGVQVRSRQKIFVVFLLMALSAGCSAGSPSWVYSYDARLIVAVEPVDGAAESDEAPARVHINFKDVLQKAGITEMPDINSIKVTRFEEQTGKPSVYRNYAYSEKEYDIPFRWYDDEIPYHFPDVLHSLTYQIKDIFFPAT